VAEVTDAARLPGEEGKLIVQYEDTLLGRQQRLPVDMVLLMGALEPAGGREGQRPEVRALLQHGTAGSPSGTPSSTRWPP